MARQLSDEQILKYKEKKATPKQVAFQDWLIDKLGLEFPTNKAEAAFREAVRLADALRMVFQASPENQAALEEQRANSKSNEEPKPKKTKAKAKAKAEPEPEPEDSDDEEVVASAPKKTKPKKASARSGNVAPF